MKDFFPRAELILRFCRITESGALLVLWGSTIAVIIYEYKQLHYLSMYENESH